ncbi:MAG: DUF3450 family protein [Planctomycetota bacterium]
MVWEQKNQVWRIRNGGSAWGAFLLAVLACFPIAQAASAGRGQDDPVGDTRAVLEKWVETRRLLSQEKRDWAIGKELLTDRIKLIEREIETLRARMKEAEESIAEADKKRGSLIEENDRLKEGLALLSHTVMTLEDRIKKLLKRLPDPIRERIKPLSLRLPDDPSETKLSLAERYQNVVGILNEVNKFNREITVTSEVRTLRDGTTAEVTSLYVGIGQAFYVSANGKSAGIGTSSSEGWVWNPADEAAAQIAEAVAIVKNEQVAGFVLLPIRIE